MKQIIVAEATLTRRVTDAIGSLPSQFGLTTGAPDLVILDAQGITYRDLPPISADTHTLVLDGPPLAGIARITAMNVLEFDPALITARSLIGPFAADFTHGLIVSAGDVPLNEQKQLQSEILVALGFAPADLTSEEPISSIQTTWAGASTGSLMSIATEREGGTTVGVRLSGRAHAVDLYTERLSVLPWSIRIADSAGEHTYPTVHETAVRAALREFAASWNADR